MIFWTIIFFKAEFWIQRNKYSTTVGSSLATTNGSCLHWLSFLSYYWRNYVTGIWIKTFKYDRNCTLKKTRGLIFITDGSWSREQRFITYNGRNCATYPIYLDQSILKMKERPYTVAYALSVDFVYLWLVDKNSFIDKDFKTF